MIRYEGKIIVIAGPTASGKSDIAIKLARDINGYVINADSRQLYKDLSIGTAKPIPDKILDDNVWLIDEIEHYLYNVVSPKDNFTLFEYQNAVQNILEKKKISKQTPILVGGTGMYIDCIVFNYDLKQNNTINSNLESLSLNRLQQLAKSYLDSMNESDRNNKHRLIRTIQRGGINQTKGNALDHIYFVIDISKEVLKDRVELRIKKMLKDGLEEENKELLSKGYTYEDKALKSIGYQEFEYYFKGEKDIDEVEIEIRNHTLQYAKRQRTWFRRNKNAIWTNDYQTIKDLASNFISIE